MNFHDLLQKNLQLPAEQLKTMLIVLNDKVSSLQQNLGLKRTLEELANNEGAEMLLEHPGMGEAKDLREVLELPPPAKYNPSLNSRQQVQARILALIDHFGEIRFRLVLPGLKKEFPNLSERTLYQYAFDALGVERTRGPNNVWRRKAAY